MRTTKRAGAFVEAVGKRVRAAREQRRLSQAALGGRLGVAHAAVSRIESGERDMRLSELFEVGRALGTKPAALVDVEEAV